MSKNKKKAAKISAATENTLKNINKILFIAVCIAVFYPPYLRGLFFETEQLPTEIFVFSVFAVFWVLKLIKRDKKFLETPVDYASFAFVIVYFISLFAAIALRQAVSEWLKYCMYFAVFLMLTELADTYKSRITVLWVILASAAGVSILGIDGAAGGRLAALLNKVFKGLGAQRDIFFDLFRNGRIFSTLQYPNTLAAYLMAVFFISLGLVLVSQKLWQKMLAGGLSFLYLAIIVLTISRGAYLIMPFAALAFLLFMPKGTRVRTVAFAIAAIIPAAPAVVLIYRYISAGTGNGIKIWVVTLAGAAASAGFVFMVDRIVNKLEAVSWKIYAGAVSVILIVCVVAGIYLLYASSPLELGNTASDKDTRTVVTHSQILKPGREYKLTFSVDAQNMLDKPFAYQVNIYSRNENDILFNKNTLLEKLEDKATNGFETREIRFRVPDDSRIVDIQFVNYYQGTKVVVNEASIVDEDTGKAKNLILKHKYLPQAISSRLQGLIVNQSTLQRAVYYKDGLNIIKDRWLLGAGGRAWEFLYTLYQPYGYTSRQPHTYWLQVGIEAGILGLLAFVALCLSLLWMFIAQWGMRQNIGMEKKILQTALFVSMAALTAHSAIDFDFSLAAVFLLFWELTALFNAGFRETVVSGKAASSKKTGSQNQEASQDKELPIIKPLPLHPAGALIVTFILFIVPVLFASAESYSQVFLNAVEKGNIGKALETIEKAAATDPLSLEYKVDYANLLLKKQNRTQADIEKSRKLVEEALSGKVYNPRVLFGASMCYMSLGDFEKGLALCDQAASLTPFKPEGWQQRIDLYFQTAIYYFQMMDDENAMKVVDKVLGMIKEAEDINRKNMNPFVFDVKTQLTLERLKFIKDNINTTEQVDLAKLVFYNVPEMDVNLDGIPDQWVINDQEHVKIANTANLMVVENISNDKTGYYIRSRNLTLSPGKHYKLEIHANGKINSDMLYYVTGVNTKAEEFILLGDVYIAGFSTPEDFNSEYCFLWLYFNGKNEIKSISIMEE